MATREQKVELKKKNRLDMSLKNSDVRPKFEKKVKRYMNFFLSNVMAI